MVVLLLERALEALSSRYSCLKQAAVSLRHEGSLRGVDRHCCCFSPPGWGVLRSVALERAGGPSMGHRQRSERERRCQRRLAALRGVSPACLNLSMSGLCVFCVCVQFVKGRRCISTKMNCFAARQMGSGCASFFHADTYVCMCSNRFLESFGGCLAMVKRARGGTETVPAIGKRDRGALCGLCL